MAKTKQSKKQIVNRQIQNEPFADIIKQAEEWRNVRLEEDKERRRKFDQRVELNSAFFKLDENEFEYGLGMEANDFSAVESAERKYVDLINSIGSILRGRSEIQKAWRELDYISLFYDLGASRLITPTEAAIKEIGQSYILAGNIVARLLTGPIAPETIKQMITNAATSNTKKFLRQLLEHLARTDLDCNTQTATHNAVRALIQFINVLSEAVHRVSQAGTAKQLDEAMTEYWKSKRRPELPTFPPMTATNWLADCIAYFVQRGVDSKDVEPQLTDAMNLAMGLMTFNPVGQGNIYANKDEVWECYKKQTELLLEADRVPQVLNVLLARLGESREGSTVATTDNPTKPVDSYIISHGSRQYSIGVMHALTVTDREDTILQSFIHRSSMDYKTLSDISGYLDAPRVLARLCEKYDGQFACAIHCPGEKNQGGYRVLIRAADTGASNAPTRR